MDLSKITAKDSITVDIALVPGLSFELAGPTHSVTLKAEREQQVKVAKMRRSMTVDERKQAVLERTASRILSWRGVEWKGETLTCTHENALMLLSQPNLSFVRDELVVAIGDDESFFVI